MSDYLGPCRNLAREEFEERFPWSFLVHSSATGVPLKPAQVQRASTLDRLVIEEALRQMKPQAHPRPVVYGVYELKAREGATRAPLVVGCIAECDVFINDASLSRVHARLSRTGSTYALLDADSTAGTQVNEAPVDRNTERELASGDRVAFGNVTLEFLGTREFYEFVRGWMGAERP